MCMLTKETVFLWLILGSQVCLFLCKRAYFTSSNKLLQQLPQTTTFTCCPLPNVQWVISYADIAQLYFVFNKIASIIYVNTLSADICTINIVVLCVILFAWVAASNVRSDVLQFQDQEADVHIKQLCPIWNHCTCCLAPRLPVICHTYSAT